MTDEVTRKNIQVSLDVYEVLTNLKRGNMTYNDTVLFLIEKAGKK